MFIIIRPIFEVLCKLTFSYVFSNILVLQIRLVINSGSSLAQYFNFKNFEVPSKNAK